MPRLWPQIQPQRLSWYRIVRMADEAQSETVESVGNNAESTDKMLGGITGKGFKPGQSGNPKGRPQRKPLTDAYIAILSLDVPGNMIPKDFKFMGIKTFADLIAVRMVLEGSKGKVNAVAEMADRVEGKALQSVALSGGDPLTELLAEFRKEHEALPVDETQS